MNRLCDKNVGNSLGFRKFRSTFANQSGPFKRTNKVTEFFVVLSEVFGRGLRLGFRMGFGTDFGAMKK